MKLTQIEVENFRCFEKITLDLHPDLTVLIAPNGGGKTSILDALRIAVWPFVKAFDLGSQTGKSATIQTEDVRRIKGDSGEMEPRVPSTVRVSGNLLSGKNDLKHWVLSREKLTPRSNTLMDAGAKSLTNYGKTLQRRVRSFEEVTLPLMAYLGTGRLWYQGRYHGKADEKSLNQDIFSRTWAYQNCITASSSYKQFEDWFVWVYKSYMEHQIHTMEDEISPEDDVRPFKEAIAVVQKAVNEITQHATGWKNLTYRTSLKQLAMSHPDHGLMPLSFLSDGLRNTVVMVADLAFRCIRLNPYLGESAALETSGIVMIDEVDMFLHPGWQQTIIGSLQRAFPNLQFVVTTHSPQVLTTVKSESIRILKQAHSTETGSVSVSVESPTIQSRGVASSDILAWLMDLDPTPDVEEARCLSAYRGLIQKGYAETPEGMKLRKTLIEHFGETHHEILECNRLIRLADMRQTMKSKLPKAGKREAVKKGA
ncbi:AAA family ATPase [Desulfoluna sp.]|uniref:AAA family ATPase n=1 Tax=Desulfoluna sp. TaxID=2045199 RepID=UPI00261FA69A|nr:AAA family ATPase [Desulfoluna sp.]